MTDNNVELYVSIINAIYSNTNLLPESDTNIYVYDGDSNENKIIAKLKWDNKFNKYYAEYVKEE
jgi:hypothetical protein